jgi:phosphatidylglycerol:prolipoprotein diacylglycerol transferase
MARDVQRRAGMWPEVHVPLPADRHVVVATHGVLVALAVLAGMLVAARRSRHPATAVVAAAAVAVAALVGAHALFVSLRGGPFGFWSGGLTSMGGVVAGLGVTWLVARLTGNAPGSLLDAIVPAGLIALGVGRLGCFLGGCCSGRPSDVPWALVVPALGGPPRHPLPLYSAALDFAVAAAAVRMAGPVEAGRSGRAALLGVMGFAAGRFALEFLRDPAATDPLPGGVTLAQALCALLLVGSFLLYRRSAYGGLRGLRSQPTLRSA